MIGISPGSGISPVFSKFSAGNDVWLSRPTYICRDIMDLIGMGIYSPASLGYYSVCHTTLGRIDINATYLTPVEEDSKLTIRNSPRLAESHFPRVFSFLPHSYTPCFLWYLLIDFGLDSHIKLAGVVLLLISILLSSS